MMFWEIEAYRYRPEDGPEEAPSDVCCVCGALEDCECDLVALDAWCEGVMERRREARECR